VKIRDFQRIRKNAAKPLVGGFVVFGHFLDFQSRGNASRPQSISGIYRTQPLKPLPTGGPHA